MICLACNNTKSKDVELKIEGEILEQFNFVCCLDITQPEESQGICNYCVEELKVSFNFKKRCLEIFANIFDHPNDDTEAEEDDIERNFMNSLLDQSLHTDDDSVNIGDLLMPFIPEICFGESNTTNTNSLSVLDVSDQTKCRYCFKEFTTKEACQLHSEEHKGDDKPYKCPHEGCESSFKARKNLKDHYLVHSDSRPFACHFCDQTFKSSSNRSKHERRIHAKERNAMKQAEAKEEQIKKNEQKVGNETRTSSQKSLPAPATFPHTVLVQQQSQINRVQKSEPIETINEKGERVFQCEHFLCKSSFKTRSSLRDHQKVHSEERPYKCNYCPSAFKSSSNRSKHERGSHSEQYQKRKLEREAEKANNGSTTETILSPASKKPKIENEEQKIISKQDSEQNSSNASAAPPSQPKRVTFPCRYCDRVFKKTEGRDKHETTHKDFLAYDCGYCYKTFKSDDILKEHMKIHITQTKFPCTYKNCTEVFEDRHSLRSHKSTHDPEEFICEVESCGRIFSSQKSLKSHKSYTKHYTNLNNEVDNDDEIITCDICLTKFDRNDEQKLAEHLRMHI
ncbi:hypothetical protein PVAND_003556 [Polypedilum vanderplanki]|uniref:C2H2-type domain-containing protein n=1 Tax=Polypedilum vanderplanki TaxID=319348 RepID=A0A9J6BUW8_POLVA|nr:hypothetical protein PVAND_003556 [Polypedilum vanderplanki]